MKHIQMNTDCEGPISLNDNAFEIARKKIEKGEIFFKQVSAYDDYLADIAKKEGYQAGDTLKLIVPWLKAAGLTDAEFSDYCRGHIALVPDAGEAFSFLIMKALDIFMVSTSYVQYARAVAAELGIAEANIYATEMALDSLPFDEAESRELESFRADVVSAPDIDIPSGAKSLADLDPGCRETIALLDEIIWERLVNMKMGEPLRSMNPVGGREKAMAISDSIRTTGRKLDRVVYAGDSITDVKALRLVSENGGLAVSFNGNRYAVEACQVAVISESVAATAVIVDVFARLGAAGALDFASGFSLDSLEQYRVDRRIAEILAGKRVEIYAVNSQNADSISAKSAAFRKKLRGEIIGALG